MMVAIFGRYSDAVAVIRDVLEVEGWDVEVFTIDEAPDAETSSRPPDLVVVDVGAFHGDAGWEVVRRLKGKDALVRRPIIVSSNDVFDLRNHEACLQDGVAAVLVQPCIQEDVRRCVTEAMNWRVLDRDTQVEQVEVQAHAKRD